MSLIILLLEPELLLFLNLKLIVKCLFDSYLLGSQFHLVLPLFRAFLSLLALEIITLLLLSRQLNGVRTLQVGHVLCHALVLLPLEYLTTSVFIRIECVHMHWQRSCSVRCFHSICVLVSSSTASSHLDWIGIMLIIINCWCSDLLRCDGQSSPDLSIGCVAADRLVYYA